MLFPGQHDLPLLANDLPLFNTPLRRLATAVRSRDGQLRLLDIGANIGDGMPLVDPRATDEFWLVEGSSEFLPYLRRNVSGYRNVTVVPTYVGEEFQVSRGSEVVTDGNAHIKEGGRGEIIYETVDRIFQDPSSHVPNLFKIDVEGHEARVFAGSRGLLGRVQPVVFMEWYPSLLQREGFGVLASLDMLREAGYARAVVYDNHGYLLEECGLDERERLEHLARYAGMRERFYFDLVVFAPRHESLRTGFVAAEEAFFAARGPVPPADGS
ncbi:MAG TPA: FkbM family methyltransferase [Opitutaceae bacterium]|jgi:FkbM family methyltransferase|nr:FkbM family methyltransferase [Opitutaceae bacterium]